MRRERLPDRRSSEIFSFEAHGHRFTGSFSRFPDGRLAELFLTNFKCGSQIGILVHDSAIILSFALQCGADVEAIRRALCRDNEGRSLGPVGQALDLLAESP
jgi:hypothetical protein